MTTVGQPSATRHESVKRLFLEALAVEPDDRVPLLERACGGDRALLREVVSLLDGHDEAGRFLEDPLLPVAVDPRPTPPAMHPRRSGPYHVRALLGQGGMGTVYLAEQRAPVHRRVALKVVRVGMDSAQVLARFERERQALALMEHPGIARVFIGAGGM